MHTRIWFLCFFFFSSRRRHTRCSRDWSSDVCSSDLELTGDQRQAIREIADDMLAPLRMHRLLMGDVGTGKTVVALFAMLLAVENDYQAAIMAPTELLAEQHLATLTRLLEPLALKPDLLIGRLAAAEKAAARARIAAGAARLGGGGHAVLPEAGTFQRARPPPDRPPPPLRGGAPAAPGRKGD